MAMACSVAVNGLAGMIAGGLHGRWPVYSDRLGCPSHTSGDSEGDDGHWLVCVGWSRERMEAHGSERAEMDADDQRAVRRARDKDARSKRILAGAGPPSRPNRSS